MKYITITILFLLAFLLLQHTQRVSERRQAYWNTQEELCSAVGWYTVTGLIEDCQPVDYLINK